MVESEVSKKYRTNRKGKEKGKEKGKRRDREGKGKERKKQRRFIKDYEVGRQNGRGQT